LIVSADALSDVVKVVLMKNWDPIGVNDEPAAQDEYDGYVQQILRLLKTDASVSKVAEHLLRIETDEMGLRGDRGRALRVAETLRSEIP
jgi:lactam utilization protein B